VARIINTADLLETSALDHNAREWVYNGLDCCVTLEVRDALLPIFDDTTRATYTFSRALQAPILDMTLTGILVDQQQRAKVLAQYREQIHRLDAQLTRIVREGIGFTNTDTKPPQRWWRSLDKLKNLLYDVMGLPPVRKRSKATGIFAPVVNREALEKLGDYFIAEPIINHLLALRDIDKKRGFLETGIDPDGRMRSNFNIAGTNTGRLASSFSDYGTGTNLQNVDRELRSVFTADRGWKFANLDLEQGDARNVGAICWNLFVEEHGETFAGSYLDACESGDLHTYVCRMSRPDLPWTGDVKKDREIAEQIAYRQDSYRQLAKKLGHGCLTADHEVLTPTGWVKISTMPETILQWEHGKSNFTQVKNWTNHAYTGTLQNFEGTSISAIMTHDHRVPFYKDNNSKVVHESPAEQGPGKFMPLGGKFVGGTEIVPARLIAAHMADGHQETNYMAFHFNKVRKFERIKALATHYGYTWKQHGDKIRIAGMLPKQPGAFMLDWTKECIADFVDELKYWDGTVGKTAVSISSTKREDLEWYQTLGRLVGIGGNISKPYVSGFGSTVYRLQQNNRQLCSGKSVKHTTIDVVNQQVYCPTVETGWFYVRRNGKIFVTGNTNYYGSPRTMAKHTKVATSVIEEFQYRYFKAFPVIGHWDRKDMEARKLPNWHNHVRSELASTHSLTTLFGRRRQFFGRSFDDATIREAIAYCPQSMTADEIDTGILNLWRSNRVRLLIQVHDSILLQYREEEEDEIIPWALEALQTKLILKKGREFVVPTEAKVGWNWGDWDEERNPEGLIKWKGSDSRKRESRPWLTPKLSILNL
jgi:DNA polymerase I-like protein with 3'-5' exonuclease and polymerase domains